MCHFVLVFFGPFSIAITYNDISKWQYSLGLTGILIFYKSTIEREKYAAAIHLYKKGKRKVQGVPQSQTAALPRPQEEEETDKSKQAQIEQTFEKDWKTQDQK